MRFPRTSHFAVMFAAMGLAGCGNSCFQGFTNNGTGFVVTTSNPACSVTKASAIVRVVAVKTPACDTCTTAARLEHVLVSLQSIELRSSSVDEASPAEWIAIPVANEVRQIDLIGDAAPEALAENAVIPAGIYQAMRLQFLPDSPANTDADPQNPCGDRRSCIISSNGRAEPLLLSESTLEFGFENRALVVLPDSHIDLRLSLEPRQVFVSGTAGLQTRYILSAQIAGK